MTTHLIEKQHEWHPELGMCPKYAPVEGDADLGSVPEMFNSPQPQAATAPTQVLTGNASLRGATTWHPCSGCDLLGKEL